MDKFEELKKYKELLDSGVISADEFALKKEELLGGIEQEKNHGLESTTKEAIEDKDDAKDIVDSGATNKTTEKKAKSKKKFIIIGAVVLLLFFLLFACTGGSSTQDNIDAMRADASYMSFTAQDHGLGYYLTSCEGIINLTSKVWQDAIYGDSDEDTEKYVKGTSDFNDALSNLFADEDYIQLIDQMQTWEYEFDTTTDVSDDIQEAKAAYIEMKTAFQELVDWCANPSGNYTNYMSTSQDKYDKFMSAYNKFDAVCPAATPSEDSEE